MPLKAAVIGTGALGLMAIKNLKEDGFDVTGFESRSYVGGLWKDSGDSTISIHSTTVFNTSKYRAAISDFPFPEEDDDFPTAVQLHRYLESYCDHFGLRPLIHLSSPVSSVRRVGNEWAIEYCPKDGKLKTEQFDKVAFATGSFFTPRAPDIKGIELFQGQVLHSIGYHGSQPFQGQRVLLIGLHATTQDVANSLSENAEKVYVAHRSGQILFPRYSDNGATYDQTGPLMFAKLQVFMDKWFPSLWEWALTKLIFSMSDKAFPDLLPEWNLRPAKSFFVTPPLINGSIYRHLKSGFVEPVAMVKRVLGATSIELTDGRRLDDIDAIIYCTGYSFDVPFSPHGVNPYPVVGEPPLLYRNIFPLSPDPNVRTSLAFLGQVAVTLPGFVQHELVGMCVSQIWSGKSQLPPLKEMEEWYRQNLRWRQETVSRHQAELSSLYTAWVSISDHLQWCDKTAGIGLFKGFGWFGWRSWSLWWTDRELYNKVMYGLLTPTIWRLFDLGRRKPWSQAREQIMKDNKLAEKQRARRLAMVQDQGNKKQI